jgi:hypothetical protein
MPINPPVLTSQIITYRLDELKISEKRQRCLTIFPLQIPKEETKIYQSSFEMSKLNNTGLVQVALPSKRG